MKDNKCNCIVGLLIHDTHEESFHPVLIMDEWSDLFQDNIEDHNNIRFKYCPLCSRRLSSGLP